MQIKLMLFSSDGYFLNQVANFISRTQKEIQVVTYSDYEKAQEYVQKNEDNIDAIVADRHFFEGGSSEAITRILTSNRTELSAVDGFYQLNIYQQGEHLIHDLKKICLERGVFHVEQAGVNSVSKTIAFFSIQGGSGQSTIAYQLAANLAQGHKVLYISFDFVNAYQLLYPVDYPVEMAQLMFSSKDKRISRDSFYQAVVHNQHGLYVLPPFQSMGDIVELTEDDVTFLLEQIQGLNEFDFILLDLNREFGNLNQRLLQMSQKIVSVYTTDFIGRLKRQQVQQDPYVTKLGILPKMEFVSSKVMQEIDGNSAEVSFPYVQAGVDLFHTFYENGGFKKSCLALRERM